MKVLIWFLCILTASVVSVLIQLSGVILGAVPIIILYGAAILLARTLCKKWDKHKKNKKPEEKSEQNTSI